MPQTGKKVYKIMYDWVGKMFHWELKRLKFDQIKKKNKTYMHKPESIVENDTHTFFWYFEI